MEVEEILETNEPLEKKLAGVDLLWISGVGEYLLQRQKAEKLLPRLKELFLHFDKKIIVEIPYDLDFIQEYQEDQVILFDKQHVITSYSIHYTKLYENTR